MVWGERYIEPAGTIVIKNESTGETCELEYKSRGGWFSQKGDNIDRIEGIIKDKEGVPRYKISGKFTETIIAT